MVKIIGVNGSPRTYGNTFKLLMVALKVAEEMGAETKLINVYQKNIKPCIGCVSDDELACRYPCIIEDDMREIYDLILDSDGIIIATPVYWYSVSGPLKNFIDRLTALENMINIDGRSWLEGKLAGFIAVGNDHGAIETIAYLMSVFNSMGVLIPPWALAYYSKRGDALKDKNAVLDAANVGRALVLGSKFEKVKEWYNANLVLDQIIKTVEKLTEENRLKEEEERKRRFEEFITRFKQPKRKRN